MKTKVGSLSDDPGRARRFAIAIPSAIAITAIFVLLAPPQRDLPPAERTPSLTVVFERRLPTPAPTPRPTPSPLTRATPVPTAPPTLRPLPNAKQARVAQRIGKPIVHHQTSGGAHAAQRALPHAAAPRTFAAPAAAGGSGMSVAAGTGSETGSGNGTGAGAGPDDAGTGADANVNAAAPCGFVDLVPFEKPDVNGAMVYEHIRATVTFPDAHTESAEFPYRWIYSDPTADPWSPRNMNDASFIVRVQMPPEGADESRFPETIRYILDHTRRETGTTTLQECPKPR